MNWFYWCARQFSLVASVHRLSNWLSRGRDLITGVEGHPAYQMRRTSDVIENQDECGIAEAKDALACAGIVVNADIPARPTALQA